MALREERTPQAIGALIAALADPDANIRWLASSTLASIGGEAVVEALAAFVEQEQSTEGRLEAVSLLGRIGSAAACAVLANLANQSKCEDRIRDAAARLQFAECSQAEQKSSGE